MQQYVGADLFTIHDMLNVTTD